jgi:LemA protein
MAKISKGMIIGISAAVLVVLVLLGIWGMYNGLVGAEINVDNAWAQVETAYQRRADLIPNLVSTVSAFANFERSVLQNVTNARSAWANAVTPQQQVAAANQMEGALARLLVTVEAYPEIKANQNFLALQDELAGTENRINVERKRYNDAVSEYNKKTRMFPSNIIAGMFGFEQREFFEAEAGAEQAPDVEFNI